MHTNRDTSYVANSEPQAATQAGHQLELPQSIHKLHGMSVRSYQLVHQGFCDHQDMHTESDVMPAG